MGLSNAYLPAAISMILLSSSAYAGEVEDLITKNLEKMGDSVQVSKIEKSVVDGLFKVDLDNGDQLFVTKGASLIIQGNLYSLNEGKITNLSKIEKQEHAAKILAQIPDDQFAHFPAKKSRGSIVVFTDPDCPYCHKLHELVPDLNAAGIDVKYLAFPRMGLGSETHENLASAWCSEDKAESLDKLFKGEKLEKLTCKNPVADHFMLGQRIGVQGTPTIFFESGASAVGVQSPDEILRVLGIK